jgi:hypothetical protein
MKALSAKLEAENQVRICNSRKSNCFSKSVVVAKSTTDKQTDVADANIKKKHCLTLQC